MKGGIITYTLSYDRKNHEFVIAHIRQFGIEAMEERYSIWEIKQVSYPFQHQGGWAFKVTLKDRRFAPKDGTKYPVKFVTYPMTQARCYDMFFQLTDDRQTLLTAN